MNLNYVAGAIFASGVIFGGAGVYWATSKSLKEKYERLLNQEVEDVKEHYRVVHQKDAYPTPQDLLAEKKESLDLERKPHETEKDYHDRMVALDEVFEEEVKGDYVKRVAAYEIQQERDEALKGNRPVEPIVEKNVFDYGNFNKPEGKSIVDRVNPYVITFEEYDEEYEDHEKYTLTYYEADDTTTDETDAIVKDVIHYLGHEPRDLFPKDTEDTGVIYVRNHALKSDFEVLFDTDSYAHIVEGAPK